MSEQPQTGPAEATTPALPPIHRVREPKMAHTSTRIRWFAALGYKPLEIHKLLGVRYQQVRNVLNTEPKRAAREDLPPLTIELYDLSTDLELMEDAALTENMAAQRLSDQKERSRVNKERRALASGGTEDRASENGFNNGALDDENYSGQ